MRVKKGFRYVTRSGLETSPMEAIPFSSRIVDGYAYTCLCGGKQRSYTASGKWVINDETGFDLVHELIPPDTTKAFSDPRDALLDSMCRMKLNGEHYTCDGELVTNEEDIKRWRLEPYECDSDDSNDSQLTLEGLVLKAREIMKQRALTVSEEEADDQP